MVAPGRYEIAFNAFDPVDGDFAAEVYGGRGPSGVDTTRHDTTSWPTGSG